jgi:2OG-Fe(II) oxygenase superfamily
VNTVFLSEMDPGSGLIDAGAVRAKGENLASAYRSAEPFPHVIIDEFLPRPILEICLAEIARGPQEDQVEFDRAQERLKREYKPDKMSPGPRSLFYAFNSWPFVSILENITGIKGLIPDPYFLGGGFHEINQGGHLSVHADFNHHEVMNVERRINVLIYLNEGWKAEYGGQLELWDSDMAKCVQSVVPELNRCVIFNTTSTSNHGNPNPVNHPNGVSRKSIALYYYTATWDGTKRSHTTQFRVRPGSSDKSDWKIKAVETMKDVIPPIAIRLARKFRSH